MRFSKALLAFGLSLAITLLGCTQDNVKKLRFGVLLPLSGPAAPYGNDCREGLVLAQEMLNAHGGINGAKVEFVIEDTAGDVAQAAALARKLTADKSIVALLAGTRTGETVAIANLLPQLKIPMVAVASTGDWRGAAKGPFNPWTWRTTRVDTYVVGPLMQVAKEHFGIKRVAIISTRDDDWSMSVLKVYERAIKELGMELVASEFQQTGDTDRSAQLTKILSTAPDGLVINCLSSDAPTIAAQARRLGLTCRFLGTAGFTNPKTWSLAGDKVLDNTLTADTFFSGSDRPDVKEFVEAFRKRWKRDPPPYAAYAYDGFKLAIEAVKKSGTLTNRDKVRDALASIRELDGVQGRHTWTQPQGDSFKPTAVLLIEGEGYKLVAEVPPDSGE